MEARWATRAGHRLLPILALSVALTGAAHADSLTLELSGQFTETTAMWVDGAGPNEETTGEVLLLRKQTNTPSVGAIALIRGVDGAAPGEILSLAWDRREGSSCSDDAPRWGIGIEGPGGERYAIYLPCQHAQHAPTGDARWVHDSFSSEMVQAAVRAAGGDRSAGGTVRALAILFTEGPANGPGIAYLDNITVNGVTWSASNGQR